MWSLRSSWLSAPSRPISGNVHAIARVRKLVQNGASATMNSAIWMLQLLDLQRQEVGDGEAEHEARATAINDVSNVVSMLCQ